jgi:hypothetical protein
MNLNELADQLETAPSISEVARLVKEKVIPMLRTKTLTDEEILRIADSIVINDRTLGNFSIDFARAILRKAQE